MVVVLADVRPGGRARVSAPTGIPAPSSRLVESRVRVLLVFAERFAELTDPLVGPAGVRGDGGLGPSMPRTYTASVREFERLVVRLRLEDRSLWWHLDGWWLSAESRTVWHCPRCGICHQPEHRHPNRRSGRLSTVRCKRVLVWSRRPGARESVAKDALVWVAERWELESEPMLPEELRVVS